MKRKEVFKELERFRFSMPEATNLFSCCLLIEYEEQKLHKEYLSKKIDPEIYIRHKQKLAEILNYVGKSLDELYDSLKAKHA